MEKNKIESRFRSKYDSTEDYITEPGTQFTPIYTPVIDADGNIDLKVTGEKNHYEEIQSHAESVDIATIIKRASLGDETALNQRVGSYLDVTDMPKNYTEYLQKIIIANTEFEKLPPEKRNNYGSVEEWLDDMVFSQFKVTEEKIEKTEEVKIDE